MFGIKNEKKPISKNKKQTAKPGKKVLKTIAKAAHIGNKATVRVMDSARIRSKNFVITSAKLIDISKLSAALAEALNKSGFIVAQLIKDKKITPSVKALNPVVRITRPAPKSKKK